MSDKRKDNQWDDDIVIENSENAGLGKDEFQEFSFDDQDGLESYLSDAVAEVTGDNEPPQNEKKKSPYRWSHKKKFFVGLGTLFSCLTFGVIFIAGMLWYGINFENGTFRSQTDLSEEQLAMQATLPPDDPDQLLADADVVNVLLIGREGIKDGANAHGRSDSMIIASMDTKKKTVKMVSIMRDCYVFIPGYQNNKLNAAYSFGGGQLLKETIEANFGIKLAGYIVVNFDAFEQVVDSVGGVDITLTEREASYLNTTNYISKKRYRTMKVGTQTVNGNQALGYCRVRKVAACNGENDDYGRTFRQRSVLTQIYAKVMSLDPTQALNLANELCQAITTDLSTVDILNYARYVLDMKIGAEDLEQRRIPAVHGEDFHGEMRSCGSSLVLNFESCNKKLWEFLYGDANRNQSYLTPDNGYSSTSTTTVAPVRTSNATMVPRPTTKATDAPVVAKTPVVTKEAEVTEAPVEKTEEPAVVTEEPVATTPPTKAPAPTKEPAPTDAPSGGEDDGSVG